jgi:hypothetical protein
MKDTSYRAYPLGQEAGRFLRAKSVYQNGEKSRLGASGSLVGACSEVGAVRDEALLGVGKEGLQRVEKVARPSGAVGVVEDVQA